MKSVFDYADKYLKKSDWKDLSLIKFCLFSMGIMVGTRVPEKKKRIAVIIAAVVFAVTYIPLMIKFFSIVEDKSE